MRKTKAGLALLLILSSSQVFGQLSLRISSGLSLIQDVRYVKESNLLAAPAMRVDLEFRGRFIGFSSERFKIERETDDLAIKMGAHLIRRVHLGRSFYSERIQLLFIPSVVYSWTATEDMTLNIGSKQIDTFMNYYLIGANLTSAKCLTANEKIWAYLGTEYNISSFSLLFLTSPNVEKDFGRLRLFSLSAGLMIKL